MRKIYHITTRGGADAAQKRGEYEPRAFAEEGFIHCSYPHQVSAVAARLFAGQPDLVLLEIDPARLNCRVIDENLEGGTELFPHIYGRLPMTAVVRIHNYGIEEEFMSNELMADKFAIREVVDNWVLYRDAGDWERFATVWHPDAWMTATWFQGPAAKFIEISREGFNKGVNIMHAQGAWTCDIAGNRAISQAKMMIMQRASVDGIVCDVECVGRFYDFMEKRSGKWGVVRRQPIYEKDRIDPVDPSVVLKLDQEILNRFPEGYRHLAYLQTKAGFNVKLGLPGVKGTAVEKLYAEGKSWLGGSATPGEPL